MPAAISRLSSQKTLDLGDNLIVEVNNTNFSALTKLYGLRLSGNKLSTIKDDVFANLDNLNVLNLSHNRITMIGERSFKNLNNLRALRLDNNMLVDLNDLVSSLDNLRWLNVSTNNLQWFDFASIPKSLEWLDVHNNRIKRIGNYYRLKTGYNLHTFDASFNDLKILEPGGLLANITHIYINNNKIANVSETSFLGLEGLRLVDLQGNALVSLALPKMSSSYGPRLLLADNPWNCDCSLSWKRSPAKKPGLTGDLMPTIGDLNSVVCSFSKVPLVSIPSSDLLCKYSAHCQPDCFCCDFFACHCRMQCPDNCSCFHDSQ